MHHTVRRFGALFFILIASRFGHSWTGNWISVGLTSDSVRVVAVDPMDAQTVYVGTTRGLFKTTDGGTNWSSKSVGSGDAITGSLAIDPVVPLTIYAGTDKGLFKSMDGGDSWRALAVGSLPNSTAECLAIDPTDHRTVYAYAWGVYKSSDAGETWISLNLYPSVRVLAINPADPKILYAGTYSGVYKSIDGGGHWSFLSSTAGYDAMALSIDPASPQTIYAAFGSRGVYKSTDAGSTWNGVPIISYPGSNLTAYSLARDLTSPSTVYAGTDWGVVNADTKSFLGNPNMLPRYVASLAIGPVGTESMFVGTSDTGLFRFTTASLPSSEVTIATKPEGIRFTLDGVGFMSSQVLSSVIGTGHFIGTDSPQTLNGRRYQFSGWSDGGAITHTLITGASAKTYTANFTAEYWLTLLAGSFGFITKSPTPADGSSYYAPGTQVLLTAVPMAGYVFDGWSGDLTGSTNPQWVTMSAPKTISAKFSPLKAEIKINTNPPGLSFTVDGITYTTAQTFSWEVGSTHLLRTTSLQGTGGTRYVFGDWSDGKSLDHALIVPSVSTAYTANFGTQYLLMMEVLPAAAGIVSISPASADGYYDALALVRMTATANSGYLFAGWRGDLIQSANPLALTVSSPLSVKANFAVLNPSGRLTVAAGGSGISATPGTSSTTSSGYALVSVDSGSVPYGTAVFRMQQNGITVSEAGVPASPPTTAARIFVDYRSGVNAVPSNPSVGSVNINTGIAVINYGPASASILYTLRDSNGIVVAEGHGPLGSRHRFTCFIDQLRDVAAPDFSLPSNFEVGSLEIRSDQQISVLAVRETVNQRNESLITTTPIADLNRIVPAGPIYFPQFADGEGYTTSIILLNTSNQVEAGILQIRDRDGNPVIVKQAGGAAGSAFSYTIPSGGLYRFQSDGSSETMKTGWISLAPTEGTQSPIGSGVFSYNPQEVMESESGIPSANATTHARVYVDLSGHHNTGIAIANISSVGSTVAIKAYLDDGVTEAGTSREPLSLSAHGYRAAFADQLVDGLPEGFRGVLDISSMQPFAALTVRSLTNERDALLMTTFPVADLSQAAPSPVVFPQIADGGGYSTQFIFIGTISAATATLTYYDGTGSQIQFGN